MARKVHDSTYRGRPTRDKSKNKWHTLSVAKADKHYNRYTMAWSRFWSTYKK